MTNRWREKRLGSSDLKKDLLGLPETRGSHAARMNVQGVSLPVDHTLWPQSPDAVAELITRQRQVPESNLSHCVVARSAEVVLFVVTHSPFKEFCLNNNE